MIVTQSEELLLQDVDGKRSHLRIVCCLEHHQLQVVRYLMIKLIYFLALQGNDTFQFEEDCMFGTCTWLNGARIGEDQDTVIVIQLRRK